MREEFRLCREEERGRERERWRRGGRERERVRETIDVCALHGAS